MQQALPTLCSRRRFARAQAAEIFAGAGIVDGLWRTRFTARRTMQIDQQQTVNTR
ncbi:MAG: hypothetical protein ACYCOY_12055 [Metallibacterium sp.]